MITCELFELTSEHKIENSYIDKVRNHFRDELDALLTDTYKQYIKDKCIGLFYKETLYEKDKQVIMCCDLFTMDDENDILENKMCEYINKAIYETYMFFTTKRPIKYNEMTDSDEIEIKMNMSLFESFM